MQSKIHVRKRRFHSRFKKKKEKKREFKQILNFTAGFSGLKPRESLEGINGRNTFKR